MKKIYTLLLLSLFLKTTIAQIKINDEQVKYYVNNSEFIFEGEIIETNHYIYRRTSTLYDAGDVYSLIVVKPIAGFKGVTDNSINFQFLINYASYTKDENGVLLISKNHHVPHIPSKGVYFLKKSTKPDFIEQPFERASFSDFDYSIDYTQNNKIEVYKYFQTNFNLKPRVFEETNAKKKV